ncbi:mannose-1-phosphate guanylyltransferase [Microlunatus parietis]|uniref:Mannose-1-phosphate guanylyltransferase n=1 Tax=Microlunatus parietis TaxID=682979 RepID=A0A7Y9I5P1_9ACTN|nr:sugar phosphate nucleotidyltransferase [Microlunatus parietis]NYE70762.1 mannose-1-phosphate guanylyltransferase [Microlunatus parietis]
MRYAVIMAGGSGTRLWPLSRKGMPKQLLPLVDGKSTLRLAYERLAGVVPDERILVCTGAAHLDLVAADVPELDPANLLGEPEGRDSLNAIAWPAALLAERDPDAVMTVLSSDHLISPVARFADALQDGFAAAESDPGALVTFGVVPTSPHTGLGYLERGAEVAGRSGVCRVEAFVEKPDRETAEGYLASGRYWWNSGMFAWRAETFLDQLRQLLPDTHAQVRELAAHPDRLAGIYPRLTKISVDYAIMEPVSQGRATGHVLAVGLPIDWQDIGGFAALADLLPRDESGNATEGPSVLHLSKDNLVINKSGDGRLVAMVGISGTVVVQTPEITLVCPLAEAGRVKELVAEVAARLGPDYA